MRTRYVIFMLFLAGCNFSEDYWYTLGDYDLYGPQFEWVEPVIFQQNLERCRTQTYCTADKLFD